MGLGNVHFRKKLLLIPLEVLVIPLVTHMKRLTQPLIAYLFLFTVISTVLYWAFIASGTFGLPGIANWLHRFPYVSPIADAWMGWTCLLFFLFWKRKSEKCFIWGIAGSSAMIFISLTAFTFRYCNPPENFDLPEYIEVIVPLYLLIFGAISFRLLSKFKSK